MRSTTRTLSTSTRLPRAVVPLVFALAAASALGLLGTGCESAGSPSGGEDALQTNDGEDPGPVDTAGFDLPGTTDAPQDGSQAADADAAGPDAGPDAGPTSLPACGAPQGHQPAVALEAVDADGVDWRSAGLTEWTGDVTVESVEEWLSPAVGPLDGEAGWTFTLNTGEQLYTFHTVLDGYHVPFAVGESLHADLYVSEPEFYAQTVSLTLTDADGALVLMAFQGVTYGFPFSIPSYECADEGDCGVLQGRGPLVFDGGLTMAPALSGATVPDRAATTVGEGDGAYLVLVHDVWLDAAPDDPPTCTDAIPTWFQLAILPAPAQQ